MPTWLHPAIHVAVVAGSSWCWPHTASAAPSSDSEQSSTPQATAQAVVIQPLFPPSRDPRRDTPSSGQPSAFDYVVEGSFALESGSLPGQAPGLELGASLHAARVSGRLTVFAFPERQVTRAEQDGGSFSLFGAAAAACVSSSRRSNTPVLVLFCGGMEAGQLQGRGLGRERRESEASLWLTPRGDVSLLFGPQAFRGLIRLGAGRPLLRHSFRLGAADVLHQTESTTWRASLGVAF